MKRLISAGLLLLLLCLMLSLIGCQEPQEPARIADDLTASATVAAANTPDLNVGDDEFSARY